MQFLLLVEDRRDEPARASVGADEMGKFARELAEQGVLRGAAGPLKPESETVRVRVKQGVPIVSEGLPDAWREVVLGYFLVDVADRAAAIELAKRCPYARAGVIEVRATQVARHSEGSGAPRFVFLYIWGPELTGPDKPRFEEMMAFSQALEREGTHIGGARLPPEIPPARVEVRGTQTVVTDGPFAETKEIIAGFALMEAANRAEAIELAKRVPHAKWDTVVVREVARP